jgi:hypothetical protein
MSAILKPRLQRRNGLEDAYLSMLPASVSRRGNAGVPTQDPHLSALQQSRLRHVSMHVYRERSVINMAELWSAYRTIATVLWMREYAKRYL